MKTILVFVVVLVTVNAIQDRSPEIGKFRDDVFKKDAAEGVCKDLHPTHVCGKYASLFGCGSRPAFKTRCKKTCNYC